ncbi:unnamed protein product [Rotaria socialis]
MNIDIPQLPYKFENLPNEILLEIFDYVHLNDLIRAFYNLNYRLNSILFSSNTHLYIVFPDDIIGNSTHKKILLDFIRRQRYIARLRLSNDGPLLEHEFIRFPYIRSLILDIPTSKHIEMVSPKQFPRLEYLRVGYASATVQLNKLHQHIFSNGFPLLKKCSLNNIGEYQSWTGSPSIYSLGIWSNDPRLVIQRVLCASMYLISFHLFLKWPSTYSILQDQIIPQHTHLKYLKLHLSGLWTLEKLDSFLAYIPTVKILDLSSSYFDSLMIYFQWNFKELSYIFSCRLPNLSHFDLPGLSCSTTIIHWSDMSTRLESLPNEILTDMFIYFDISSLYHSFSGLNQRFNNLIQSLKHHALIIEKHNLSLIELYASQIMRLKINTPLPIDINECSNLISLELCQASKNQIEQIRSDIMPNLVYLTIIPPYHISLPMEFTQEVFSNSFHHLRSARLSRLDTFELLPGFQSLSLRTLYITCTNANTIHRVLQACPNLFSLHAQFFGQHHHIVEPISSVYNHSLEKFLLDDPYHNFSFDTLNTIFLCIPNVKYLVLQFSCRVPFIDLVENILTRLTQLDHFECDILEFPNDHMVNVEIIQQMNECFRVLESFHNLKFVFYLTTSNNSLISNDQIFPVYGVDSNVDVGLNRFSNIRRLKFEWFSTTELARISANVLPYLEELNLVYIATLRPYNGSLFLSTIRTLKTRFTDFSSYQTFLSACANLSCFQCSIFTSDKCNYIESPNT